MSKSIGFFGGKFSPLHNGHIRAIIEASTIVDELHVVVISDDEWEKEHLYKQSKFPFFPVKHRARWIKESFKDHENIIVHFTHQPVSDDGLQDWRIGSENIKKIIDKDITHVFSSEYEYDKYFQLFYPHAQHIVIDEKRTQVPISSTSIRQQGAMTTWDFLPESVRKDVVKKVAIIGTESNGKSTLVKNLSLMFNTRHVEEYGRNFMYEVGDTYTLPHDYHTIVMQHWINVEQEKRYANKVLFVDTEAVVTQNFSHMYEDAHQNIIDAVIKIQDYDLILFLEPDVKWVDDGTRMFGEDSVRQNAHEQLTRLVQSYGLEYVSICGDFNNRLSQAYAEIEKILV